MLALIVLLSLSHLSNALPLQEEPAWLHASLRITLDTSLRILPRDTTIIVDSIINTLADTARFDTIRFTSTKRTNHHRKYKEREYKIVRKHRERKPNKDGLIEVYCRYITRHGKRIYPKHGEVFHFFVKPKKNYHPRE